MYMFARGGAWCMFVKDTKVCGVGIFDVWIEGGCHNYLQPTVPY